MSNAVAFMSKPHNRRPLPMNREMLVRTYELLAGTPPFSRWKMPPSSEVGFQFLNAENTRGAFRIEKSTRGARPTIYISRGCVGTLYVLLVTMAHEMVHLHEDTVHRARGDVMHSGRFRRLAAQVCKHHLFDEMVF